MKDRIPFRLFTSELNRKSPHRSRFNVILNFSIASGVQNELHPHPGRSFFAVGFPRTCYIPDCPLGRKVSFHTNDPHCHLTLIRTLPLSAGSTISEDRLRSQVTLLDRKIGHHRQGRRRHLESSRRSQDSILNVPRPGISAATPPAIGALGSHRLNDPLPLPSDFNRSSFHWAPQSEYFESKLNGLPHLFSIFFY